MNAKDVKAHMWRSLKSAADLFTAVWYFYQNPGCFCVSLSLVFCQFFIILRIFLIILTALFKLLMCCLPKIPSTTLFVAESYNITNLLVLLAQTWRLNFRCFCRAAPLRVEPALKEIQSELTSILRSCPCVEDTQHGGSLHVLYLTWAQPVRRVIETWRLVHNGRFSFNKNIFWNCKWDKKNSPTKNYFYTLKMNKIKNILQLKNVPDKIILLARQKTRHKGLLFP